MPFPSHIAALFPITRVFHKSMFDGVVMNVMEVVFKITIVPNDMVPKPFLPNFQRLRSCKSYYLFELSGEIWLERMHDVAEIGFTGWVNDHMEMVGQKAVP